MSFRTSINGKPAEWEPWLWIYWEQCTPIAYPGTITQVNYFTPRPYRHEYDRGSSKEGFTYVIEHGGKREVGVFEHEVGLPHE